ncbi:hypothetical protein [Pseudoalteromonas sp. MMG022]|uniref:hypothetical protein n=1 Tax=Pseudoalteromonas sp. MMG022 TaxID=2909978 RepID=UPI001F2F0B17|nr:hypothetical protein [Pseudoalteromonas sp. MMG022]MCF6434342.1 hypothetical protein [Pseudoalteromonas sp. MMG022]
MTSSRNLRSDFYDGYNDKLTQLAAQHKDNFKSFLTSLLTGEGEQKTSKQARINKEYRYLYRSYLRPPHLKLSAQHQHYF